MKEGKAKIKEVLALLEAAVNSSNYEETLKQNPINVKRKIRTKKLVVREDAQLEFIINNATIENHPNMFPANPDVFRFHESERNDLSGCDIWEVRNLGMLIRNSQMNDKRIEVKDIPEDRQTNLKCFMVTKPLTIMATSPKKWYGDLFEVAENVRLIQDKWVYYLY